MIDILNIITVLIIGLANYASADVDFNLGAFENVNVLQAVDVVSPYLKQRIDLDVENIGGEEAYSYLFVIPEKLGSSLANIAAKDSHGRVLEIGKADAHPVAGYDLYKIIFETPLKPHEKVKFGVMLAFAKGTTPFPAEAKQSEVQWMLYEGSQNYISIYKTRSQKTEVSLITDRYELIVGNGETEKPAVDSTGSFVLGPFEDVSSLELIPLSLRYENPLPMTHIENLRRSIWVSHWGGSVSFDESYDIHNVGTKLTSTFSRLDYSKPRVGFNLNNAAIRALRIALPVGHREEYYVDLVGNVSTSTVSNKYLDAYPRYPVMGGWFYNFTVGCASDLKNFVREPTPSNYILAVPLVGGPDKVSYSKVVNTIILPEGADKIEIFSDVPYDNLNLTTTYSYLDINGRPTIEVEYNNVVSEQSKAKIYVTYHYTTAAALRKPISYMAAISLILIASKRALNLF